MAALASAVGELLKTVYSNTTHDHLNSKDHIFGMLPKDYDGDGEEFVSLHRVGGTNSMGFQPESASLPVADRQRWANSNITPREWWGTLEISQRLVSQSKTRSGAFLKGFDGEVYGFSRDTRRFFEIRVMGDGSGTLGVPPTTNGLFGSTVFFPTPIPLRRVQVGQVVNFWTVRERDPASTTITWDLAATQVDLTVKTVFTNVNGIEFEEAINPGSALAGAITGGTAFMAQKGARTNQVRYEIMGLDGAISDRDSPMEDGGNGGLGLQGILAPVQYDGITANPNGQASWASPSFRNGGILRPVSESVLHQALDAVEIAGNGMVDTFVSPYGVRLDFALDQLTIRRNTNTTKIAGNTAAGFDEDVDAGNFVEYGGYRIIPQRHCRANTAYALSWERQGIKFWARPQWWDDGNILRRSPNSTTTYQAEMFAMFEYYVEERNAHARIEDLEGTEVPAA